MSNREDLSLNEIEGISNYAAFVKAGKEEFNKTADKGVGMTFWILGFFLFEDVLLDLCCVSLLWCLFKTCVYFFKSKYMFEMIYIIFTRIYMIFHHNQIIITKASR